MADLRYYYKQHRQEPVELRRIVRWLFQRFNMIGQPYDQSALAPESFTTLAHFSVSCAMSLPKSSGEPGMAMPPRSANRAFTLESARPALTSRFNLWTMSAAVPVGPPSPYQALAS